MTRQRKEASAVATTPSDEQPAANSAPEEKSAAEFSGAVDCGLRRLARHVRLALPPYAPDQAWDKDDVCGILHWIHQSVAIFVGVLLGVFGVRGWLGFAIGVLSQLTVCRLFVERAGVPDQIYTPMEAAQEGAMATFMTFVLFWTVTHSLLW